MRGTFIPDNFDLTDEEKDLIEKSCADYIRRKIEQAYSGSTFALFAGHNQSKKQISKMSDVVSLAEGEPNRG